MSKEDFICAFFDRFERKISRLTQLFNSSFTEEAFTLCVVYIDRLASGHFGGGPGKNHENFCRALRELSGDPVFSMVHPGELLEQAQNKFPCAVRLLRIDCRQEVPGSFVGRGGSCPSHPELHH